MGKTRILIVDDHALFRDGLAAVLERQEDLALVGEAGDAETAIRLAAELRPDVILMDLQLPGRSGVEATLEILATQPSARIIGLTMYRSRAEPAAPPGRRPQQSAHRRPVAPLRTDDQERAVGPLYEAGGEEPDRGRSSRPTEGCALAGAVALARAPRPLRPRGYFGAIGGGTFLCDTRYSRVFRNRHVRTILHEALGARAVVGPCGFPMTLASGSSAGSRVAPEPDDGRHGRQAQPQFHGPAQVGAVIRAEGALHRASQLPALSRAPHEKPGLHASRRAGLTCSIYRGTMSATPDASDPRSDAIGVADILSILDVWQAATEAGSRADAVVSLARLLAARCRCDGVAFCIDTADSPTFTWPEGLQLSAEARTEMQRGAAGVTPRVLASAIGFSVVDPDGTPWVPGAAIVLPLADGELGGAVLLCWRHATEALPSEARLQVIGQYTAWALRHVWRWHSARRGEHYFALASALIAIVGRARTVTDMLEAGFTRVLEDLACAAGAIYLAEGEPARWSLAVAKGHAPADWPSVGLDWPPDPPVALGQAAGGTMDHAATDVWGASSGVPWVAVPIASPDATHGVMCVAAGTSGGISDVDFDSTFR